MNNSKLALILTLLTSLCPYMSAQLEDADVRHFIEVNYREYTRVATTTDYSLINDMVFDNAEYKNYLSKTYPVIVKKNNPYEVFLKLINSTTRDGIVGSVVFEAGSNGNAPEISRYLIEWQRSGAPFVEINKVLDFYKECKNSTQKWVIVNSLPHFKMNNQDGLVVVKFLLTTIQDKETVFVSKNSYLMHENGSDMVVGPNPNPHLLLSDVAGGALGAFFNWKDGEKLKHLYTSYSDREELRGKLRKILSSAIDYKVDTGEYDEAKLKDYVDRVFGKDGSPNKGVMVASPLPPTSPPFPAWVWLSSAIVIITGVAYCMWKKARRGKTS